MNELKHNEEEEANEFDSWFQDFLNDDSEDEESTDDDIQLDIDSADIDTLLAACRSLQERKQVLLRYAKQRVIQRIEG